jgi:replicative DNA helicase
MTNQPYPSSGFIDRPAPYSEEAEEAVLGAILSNPNVIFNIASFLTGEDFYILRHQYIWEAIQRIVERGEEFDYLTVSKELLDIGRLEEVGGPWYLLRLVNNTPTSVHAEVYAKVVERAAVRRRLLAAADAIKALALNEEMAIEKVTDEAEARLFGVTESQLKRDLVPISHVISEYWERMERLIGDRDEALGLPTGFRALDTLLGGLQKSDLLIFAGRPGMGKCVAQGTLISTDSGLVPVENLKPHNVDGIFDDEGGIFYPLQVGVQTPNGMRQTAYFYDSGIKPTLRITTRAGYALTGTHVHPVLTRSASGRITWKCLADIRYSDEIAINSQFDLHWDEIIQIEDAGLQPCYDLTIPDGHTFVANGIVNHNTSFMLSVALNAARFDKRIAIFTMEMGVEQIIQRMVSMETGINMQRLRLGQVDELEWRRLVEAMSRLRNFKIFIDDTPAMSPMQMRAKCRRLAREQGIDLIMVDYIQLMNAGGVYENNRVQEVSHISRNLKELARELNVPVFSAAQLSRAVEQRQDKRPQLSDLRESGCLAGDSLIYMADTGRYIPIRELNGRSNFRVMSLNPETWKLEAAEVINAFCTGVKRVYRLMTQLGRTIRATANHKFLTIHGWKRLDELTTEDCLALPRTLNSPCQQTMSDAELGLLGHLIGDGCTLPTHAIQYTTRELDLAEAVVSLATKVFGDRVRPRIHQEKGHSWYQVFIPPSFQLTHGIRNPVRVWLEELGVFGLRSHEKRIPIRVFEQPLEAIAVFLRHLLATDGSITMKRTQNGYYPNLYYASSSQQLAYDVQSLMLRLEINARIMRISQNGKGRDQYHVVVSGNSDLKRFVQLIGAVGDCKNGSLASVEEYLNTHPANTNRDVIPREVWRMYVVPAMQEIRMTSRQMQAELGNAYCGTGLYKQNLSRERATRLAQVVQSDTIAQLGDSDIYWDRVVSIEADGESDVYDLTVPGNSNFIANNIITHNSLEQDSDIVMFLYRDEVYNEATESPNQADIIIAKHRNGPTGVVSLYFDKTITRFMDATAHNIDLSRG